MRILFVLNTTAGAMRLQIQQKTTALETENEKLRIKMQSAIEGLAKQFSPT